MRSLAGWQSLRGPQLDRRGAGIAALLVLLVLPGAAVGQQPVPNDDRQGAYLIGTGDSLHLFVWKEPDLSRELTVRLDGRVTVPLLGDVEAVGLAPEQLARAIEARFKKYLAAPQVSLGVTQASSSRFYVLGQVNHPGAFPLTTRTSLVQALAQAGGFKEFAKPDRVVVVRDQQGQQVFIPVNYKRLEGGNDISQNIQLRPGDTVLVP